MSLGTPHYMSPEQAMGDREISALSHYKDRQGQDARAGPMPRDQESAYV